MKNAMTPAIFWHSDPVNPDETLVIAGGNFSPDAVVELAIVSANQNGGEPEWTRVAPLQTTGISLKAVIPSEWAPGIYACRIRQGEGVSKTVYVNAPDVWWKQGDEGVDRARQGGWLRVLGKCLDFESQAGVSLQAEGGPAKPLALEMEDRSCFSLKAKLPAGLALGKFRVLVSNGKGGSEGVRDAGALEVLPVKAAPKAIINVLDLGADPAGMKDCTLPIVQAIERLSMIGGGVVYFPQGRYRIDAILRSGTWIKSPLFIPENITLRGESPDLVSLWWPDQERALPTLIDGRNDFAIEGLSIFTQGYHSTIITGSSNVRIRNVRIRANYYYMTNNNGEAHHERAITPPVGSGKVGPAILLWGENNQVTDCDILHLTQAFDLRGGRGSLIANNTVRAHNMHVLNGTCEMIFENNENTGNSMSPGGNNIGLHMGASICKHVFYANNRSSHLYGGDHEALTLDGHATAYLGKVRDTKATSFVIAGKTFLGDQAKGAMTDMHSAAAFIIDGTGAGQYRWLTGCEGDKITIDREWDLPPDQTSLVSIGGFNGRHLFINNTAIDTGTLIQLYPPNCECILSGNRSIRASNINSLGKLGKIKSSGFVRVENSWYNQFLDNHVITGNTWGGGSTQIDRWIGGECTLNIWGWEIYYYSVDGRDQDVFLTPEVLKQVTGETQVRAKSIPISRFQIVRRHKVDNNSSIRIHGAVADVLIEGCDLNLSRKGIRIDQEMDYVQPSHIGQLFDFDPEPSVTNRSIPFLSPEAVLIRNNKFKDVKIPYSGTAMSDALLVEK
ncbi:MAG: glycosyl hydrolase family 28-related protein [Verrucomicrobiae bacterium]